MRDGAEAPTPWDEFTTILVLSVSPRSRRAVMRFRVAVVRRSAGEDGLRPRATMTAEGGEWVWRAASVSSRDSGVPFKGVRRRSSVDGAV